MSRITKEIAEKIALQLTEKKKKQLEDLDKKIQSTIEGYILKRIPKQVVDFFNDSITKEYTKTYCYVRVEGPGLNKDHRSIGYVPVKNTSTIYLELESSESIPLSQMIMEEKSLTVEYKNLVEELEAALYSMRTFKKVKDMFPEASKFLPEEREKQEIVNISLLRQKLN